MARPYTICAHPERQAIDSAIVAGAALATIATEYHVIDESLRRHRDSHLPARLVKAQEVEDVRQALDVVRQLKAINGATLQILTDARQQRDADTALKAIDRIHKQIELQAKLLGELDERPQVNVLIAPEWLSLRGAILAALVPYADARAAVVDTLLRLDGGAA